MSRKLATLIGFAAIVMWASMVGLLKQVSATLGADLGLTLVYSCSTILVLMIFKLPNFKLISKQYLILGTILFVTYELFFAFAIAYSKTAQQAIEVSIINYLWPSFTILAFVIFKELKFNFMIIVGLLFSISGIVFIQAGKGDFSINSILINLVNNPISYILAFVGAILWAFYCVVTKKMSNGQNPISIFFIMAAITLWTKLLMTQSFTVPEIDLSTAIYILTAALAVGLGYAAWNVGIVHGNITILVVASYFTPVISSILAMFILQTELSITFWQGTFMVTTGSFICWFSTNWTTIKKFYKKSISH